MTDGRLTHDETQGTLTDLFQRLASTRGHYWLRGLKRYLVAKSPDFYMLDVNRFRNPRVMLERMAESGAYPAPPAGRIRRAIETSTPQGLGTECLGLTSVRAMGFPGGATSEQVRRFGRVNKHVATSYEAACMLFMEPEGKGLLRLSPSPIVWTFLGGNYENRQNLFLNDAPVPELVALVSKDADMGVVGIVEPEVMGRDTDRFEPNDMFLLSLEI